MFLHDLSGVGAEAIAVGSAVPHKGERERMGRALGDAVMESIRSVVDD